MGGNRPAAGLRREARRLRRGFYARAWRPLLVGVAIMASGLLAVPLIPHDLAQGIAIGVIVTAAVSTVLRVAHEADGGRSFRDGADAEQWTATDLRWFSWRRRLRGQRWYVVHSIGFQWGDVDHVLVGPGGIYAVETKYRSRQARQPDLSADVERAHRQLARASRRIAALVEQLTDTEVNVGTILVTHGHGCGWHTAAAWRWVDDTLLLRGSHAHHWHTVLPDDGLPPATCRTIAGALAVWSVDQLQATAHTS